jgi:hypothetical protein
VTRQALYRVLAYTECSNEIDVKRSEQFDQVIGLALGLWFETVTEVTASPEMRVVTNQMLRCIAEAGGPDVKTVMDLYSDRIAPEADSLVSANQANIERAQLIEVCAGEYDATRESLLLPRREKLMAENPDVLATAESYFNEVMVVAGIAVDG